jgi:hypothetical protein
MALTDENAGMDHGAEFSLDNEECYAAGARFPGTGYSF